MPVKKTTKRTAVKKVTAKTVSAESVSANTAKKAEPSFLDNFNREDNLHMFVGIVLLII